MQVILVERYNKRTWNSQHIFISGLSAIQNTTTVLLSAIVTDLTVPATSYYHVTVQRVGKIRKQSVCIPIKIGKIPLM